MTAEPVCGQDLAAAYAALRQGLLRYLRRHAGGAAEDLLQEVFLKALAAGKRKEAPKNTTGWLYAIARNTAIDFYRAKRPTDTLPDDLAAQTPDDTAAMQELATCLLPLTQQLPAMYRDTLIAADFQGESLLTLARAGNVSVSAVKSRASRGRKMLKEKLLACCSVELSDSGSVLDYRPYKDACGNASGRCRTPGKTRRP